MLTTYPLCVSDALAPQALLGSQIRRLSCEGLAIALSHPLLKFNNHLRFQRPFKRLDILNIFRWCPGAESNHRHEDFQSTALPTELPGQKRGAQREGRVLNPRTLHASSNARPDVRPVSIGSVLLWRCCQCRALPIDDSMPAARKSQVITLA